MTQFKFSNHPVWSVPSSSAVTRSTQSMSWLVTSFLTQWTCKLGGEAELHSFSTLQH